MNIRLAKKLVIALCVICTVTFLNVRAWAIGLSFSPSVSSTGIGGSVSVDVIVSGLQDMNLSAFDFNINFDDTILNFESYTLGDGLGYTVMGEAEDWSFGDIGNGVIHLSELSYLSDFDFQSDSFTLATLSFIGENLGISDLIFSGVILGDEMGDAMVASLESGNVEVSGTPEPATLLLMSSGLIGLTGIGRKRFIKA